jgi:hypothetical protein
MQCVILAGGIGSRMWPETRTVAKTLLPVHEQTVCGMATFVARFLLRANAFFADHAITVKRVLTDNGNCYRSGTFAVSLGTQIPTNGPVRIALRPMERSRVCYAGALAGVARSRT